jgi:lipopolysaccharide transport protein LptA
MADFTPSLSAGRSAATRCRLAAWLARSGAWLARSGAWLARGAAGAALAMASAGAPAAGLNLVPGQAISLDAQSYEADARSGTMLFHKVKISQGSMSIAADTAQASGLDFDNSHWVFRGNVRISLEGGQLTSDQADVTFAKKLLAKAVITGKPAEFEQHIAKNGRLARGRADSIDYDVGQGMVRLSQNAWLSDGSREISGQSLSYSVAEQRVVATAAEDSQGSQRVHITITPPPQTPKP